MQNPVVIGIDVGTGSVRAGVFTLDGTMLAAASSPILEFHPEARFLRALFREYLGRDRARCPRSYR